MDRRSAPVVLVKRLPDRPRVPVVAVPVRRPRLHGTLRPAPPVRGALVDVYA